MPQISFLKLLGHLADAATIISFPLLLIPLLAYWGWTRWKGNMQTKYKVLLVVSMLFGAIGYAVDMADRFSLFVPPTHLQLQYIADGSDPKPLRQDNIFKFYSFQFADDGSDAHDPKQTKWTILVIVFDKPLASNNPTIRVLFEGGSLRYQPRNPTSRSIQIRFDGSMGNRVVDIEIQS